MRRWPLFLLIILVAVLSLVSFVGTFLPHQMMMSSMMGGGFGGMSFFWPMVFTASTIVVIVEIVYVMAFPNIRYASSGREEETGTSVTSMDPMDIVMRVSKADERAVLDVLKQSGGVCLQKDIVYQTRFSKVKTHRIVARLAERGVVLVKKSGKTNEVSVPTWLRIQSLPGELAAAPAERT